MKAVLCLSHGNTEAEGSPSENSKVLAGEQRLLSDNSINAIRLTKYVLGVTGSGHAHKIPITPSLMHARRSSYSVYAKCIDVENARKEKDMQQNAKTDNEDQNTHNIIFN